MWTFPQLVSVPWPDFTIVARQQLLFMKSCQLSSLISFEMVIFQGCKKKVGGSAERYQQNLCHTTSISTISQCILNRASSKSTTNQHQHNITYSTIVSQHQHNIPSSTTVNQHQHNITLSTSTQASTVSLQVEDKQSEGQTS